MSFLATKKSKTKSSGKASGGSLSQTQATFPQQEQKAPSSSSSQSRLNFPVAKPLPKLLIGSYQNKAGLSPPKVATDKFNNKDFKAMVEAISDLSRAREETGTLRHDNQQANQSTRDFKNYQIQVNGVSGKSTVSHVMVHNDLVEAHAQDEALLDAVRQAHHDSRTDQKTVMIAPAGYSPDEKLSAEQQSAFKTK